MQPVVAVLEVRRVREPVPVLLEAPDQPVLLPHHTQPMAQLHGADPVGHVDPGPARGAVAGRVGLDPGAGIALPGLGGLRVPVLPGPAQGVQPAQHVVLELPVVVGERVPRPRGCRRQLPPLVRRQRQVAPAQIRDQLLVLRSRDEVRAEGLSLSRLEVDHSNSPPIPHPGRWRRLRSRYRLRRPGRAPAPRPCGGRWPGPPDPRAAV